MSRDFEKREYYKVVNLSVSKIFADISGQRASYTHLAEAAVKRLRQINTEAKPPIAKEAITQPQPADLSLAGGQDQPVSNLPSVDITHSPSNKLCQFEIPDVKFTTDGNFRTTMSPCAVDALLAVIDQKCSILPGTPPAYPASNILTRQANEFYSWYETVTKTYNVRFLDVSIHLQEGRIGKTLTIPFGNLSFFQILKLYIWNSFWASVTLDSLDTLIFIQATLEDSLEDDGNDVENDFELSVGPAYPVSRLYGCNVNRELVRMPNESYW